MKDGSFLKEVPAPCSTEVDTSTDLRVELALQHLGLAADMGGVLSFSKHEDLRLAFQRAKLETLRQAMRACPPSKPAMPTKSSGTNWQFGLRARWLLLVG